MSKRGYHAISITNKSEESVVIGYTNNVEKSKSDLLGVFVTDSGWEHDPDIDYHKLQVSPKS